MELDDILEEDSKKKTILVLGAVALTIIVLALITYFFFYNDEPQYNNDDLGFIESAPIIESAPVAEAPISESTSEAPIIESAPVAETIEIPKVEAPKVARNTISSLKYTIKPLNKNIAVCENMRNGKWEMPKSCAKNLQDSIQNLISTNSEIIAIEVSGIVDSSPYAGPSAELKQEGLASFRAREAIILITRNFSNVAAFEGPSKQEINKRGFEVRAYYLQN